MFFVYTLFFYLFNYFIAINIFYFMEKRYWHNKIKLFGTKNDPTEFLYNHKSISIYYEVTYFSKFFDIYNITLYINNIPIIEINCLERIFYISRNIKYNDDYNMKEIKNILKQGLKQGMSGKFSYQKPKKSIIGDE